MEAYKKIYKCPQCGSELTPDEIKFKKCLICKTSLKDQYIKPEYIEIEPNEYLDMEGKVTKQKAELRKCPRCDQVYNWYNEFYCPKCHVRLVPLPVKDETLTLSNIYSTKPSVKCPICGSYNVAKISFLGRVFKVSLFGTIGALDDAGKTYKCNECGCKF